MAIIRTKRLTRFTVINNDLLEDKRLDWRDLGLLTYLLSKPDNWEVSVAHLQKERKTGRYAIYESLKNLIAAGYVKGRAKQGGFEYEVFDVSTIHLTENHDAENHDAENHRRENPPQVNTDSLTKTDNSTNTDIEQELTLSKESARKKAKNLGGGNEAKKEMGFKKPTVEDIETYVFENGFAVDAGRFFDYYESNGWLVSKAPMKNWQATVRNWNRENLKRGQQGGSNATHQQHNKPAKLSAEERFERAKAERDRNKSAASSVPEDEFIRYG